MSGMRRISLVAAICLGTFMASLDISIVNVALPTMLESLQTDMSGLQWVVDAYALCLSALILSSGRWAIDLAASVFGCTALHCLPSVRSFAHSPPLSACC